MSEDWSREEVAAAVSAYVEMLNKWKAGEKFTKASYNERLRTGSLSARSKGSVEYRMQNISSVLDEMGLEWLLGYKPARNVGHNVRKQIQDILSTKVVQNQDSGGKTNAEASSAVSSLRKTLERGEQLVPPSGTHRVRKTNVRTEVYKRDLYVKAWVLHNAKGLCEGCGQAAPFVMDDGLPFLEIHHMKTLSTGGPDTTDNTVALCPNCHRMIHLGKERVRLRERIFSKVNRLTRYR